MKILIWSPTLHDASLGFEMGLSTENSQCHKIGHPKRKGGGAAGGWLANYEANAGARLPPERHS
jgi:hypothetical protein